MSGAKLLLVEDDPSLLELLEFRFTSEGYNVRATPDGDDSSPVRSHRWIRPRTRILQPPAHTQSPKPCHSILPMSL